MSNTMINIYHLLKNKKQTPANYDHANFIQTI